MDAQELERIVGAAVASLKQQSDEQFREMSEKFSKSLGEMDEKVSKSLSEMDEKFSKSLQELRHQLTEHAALIVPHFHNLRARAHNTRVRRLSEVGRASRGEATRFKVIVNDDNETPPGEWPRSIAQVRTLTEEQLISYAVRDAKLFQ